MRGTTVHSAPRSPAPADFPGRSWLSHWTTDPAACQAAWDEGGLAPIPLGGFWAVQTSASLGYRALRSLPGYGPVLHSVARGTIEFLVAPLAAAGPVPGIGQVLETGHLLCPAPEAAVPMMTAAGLPVWRTPRWAVPPDGTGRLPDPGEVLRALGEDYERVLASSLAEQEEQRSGPARPDADRVVAFIEAGRAGRI
ncbi:hypothetical protein ACFVSN_30580 [Kitasatospora sp. NPDC057904]|uniref:hypothetical protein n=1 Tax=Kitasatospora sp. NPDC057904 TaxID=3346275 RepID=UPI0036DE6AEE